jgi:hypothetical protein
LGSKGHCFDNAVAERFLATLKKELIHGRSRPSKAEPRTAVFEHIEIFFNRRRRHSTLAMLSPPDYENSSLDPGPRLAAPRLASTDRKIKPQQTQAAQNPRVHRSGGTPQRR